MSEQKKSKDSEIRSGPRLLSSEDESEDIRYWYLDRKHHKERNTKLAELYNQWEECFLVGKFDIELISNLRYWSWIPNR